MTIPPAQFAEASAPAAVIRADFDRLAPLDGGWDHNSHFHGFLLGQLPAHCADALEVGCGTGAFARLLARRSDHVLALDLSPEMIRIARARSAAHPNIEFQVADVMAWPLQSERYNCITSIAALHHLPLAAALERFRDALRPGGVLASLDLFKGAGAGDMVLNLLSVPLAGGLRLAHCGRLRPTAAQRAAWDQHGQHDHYLTIAEARRACDVVLPGAAVLRHPLWRYSIVWRKLPPP